MAVQVKVVGNRMPGKTDLMYRAVAVSKGVTDLNALADMVSDQTSLTKADCYGVLLALEYNIINELKEGRIVRLGDLGSFQIGVHSELVSSKKMFRASHIKSAKIIYRPGTGFKRMLRSLRYRVLKK